MEKKSVILYTDGACSGNPGLGGYGGIQHCLIPSPKHIIIDRDKDDNEYYTRLFAKEQSYRSMLRILGY